MENSNNFKCPTPELIIVVLNGKVHLFKNGQKCSCGVQYLEFKAEATEDGVKNTIFEKRDVPSIRIKEESFPEFYAKIGEAGAWDSLDGERDHE